MTNERGDQQGQTQSPQSQPALSPEAAETLRAAVAVLKDTVQQLTILLRPVPGQTSGVAPGALGGGAANPAGLKDTIDGLTAAITTLTATIRELSGQEAGSGDQGKDEKGKGKGKGEGSAADAGKPPQKGGSGSGRIRQGYQKGKARGSRVGAKIGRQFGPRGEKAGAAVGGGIGGVIGGISAAVQVFTDSLKQTASQVLSVIGRLTPFVEAINPALVQSLGVAMRDLFATIGYALVPVFQVLVDSIRQVSGIILPVVRELQPVIRELAVALGSQLVEYVRLAASVIRAFMPAIEVITALFIQFTQVIVLLMDIMVVLVRTLADVAKGFGLFSSGDLKDSIKSLGDLFRNLAKQVVLMTATVLKFLGMTSVLDAMLANFQKLAEEQANPAAGLKGAATSAGIKDASQIARDAAAASAIASGVGSGEKSQTAYLADMVKGIADIKGSGQTFQQFIADQFNKLIKAITPTIPSLNQAASTASSIPGIGGTIKGAGVAVGNAASWAARQVGLQ